MKGGQWSLVERRAGKNATVFGYPSPSKKRA